MEACVYFQKVFDTVVNDILMQKSNYYGVRGTANISLLSHL